jgi:hypothetical protein
LIRDPIPVLQKALRSFLLTREGAVDIDGVVAKTVPWRPHLFERKLRRGWYIHPVAPVSTSWAERIGRARFAKANLKVGIAATDELLSDERFLDLCHELGAAILPFVRKGDAFAAHELFPSVEDYICRKRLKLSWTAAEAILDRALQRALAETNKQRKGVFFELVVAVLLSQVDGFEVASIGIANRSQQMDVLVHNRNTGGALGLSPIVLAEAKNWRNPVDVPEYAAFVRKLQSRHGRAKLGYLITTNRFTSGVGAERRRESMNDTLVVLIDGKSLPVLWKDPKGITAGIEHATVSAAIGT